MKLTVHDACWDAAASPWSDRALAAGVRWIKVVDDPARAYAIAQKYPACNVIYRKVAPQDIEQLSDLRKHPEFRDAQACAEMFVRLADIATLPNLYVEGANEVKLANYDDAQWYGRVEAIRATLLANRGLRAVVGNFATGNPTLDLFSVWLQTFALNGGPRSALIGLHEYGAINVPAAQDTYNLLRHRRLGASGWRWAITECGLDRIKVGGQYVGGGWRAPGSGVSDAAYWQFMADFNAELEKDDSVACACVFSYGDTERWKDYEMNDAQTFNGNLVAAIAAIAAASKRTYTRGIDVSSWQTVTNWQSIADAGIKFAFIRNCDALTSDTKFAANWYGARGKVLRGAYQYFRCTTSGKAQADVFLARIDPNDLGELPAVCDLEQNPTLYGVTPATYATHLRMWVDTIEAAYKRRPIIYTRPDIWAIVKPFCPWADTYPLWIARYPFATVPTLDTLQTGAYDAPDLAPFGRWRFWQYTSSGVLPGVSAPVDLDVFDGDEAALRAFAGITIQEPMYTWQAFINVCNIARQSLGYSDKDWWSWLFTRAGLDDAANKRTKAYDGPKIDDLNWSAKEIAAYRAAGGKG